MQQHTLICKERWLFIIWSRSTWLFPVSSHLQEGDWNSHGLAKTTQQCEGQEGWKWVVSSVSTGRASGTSRRPRVRYLVNSLPPIIHFQASAWLVYKLSATLALSFGKTARPAYRTVLRGADESPACFWMSCCLPNAFSPQPCTSAALRWACMPAVRLSMSAVYRLSRHRESSSCLSSAYSPSENDVWSFG